MPCILVVDGNSTEGILQGQRVDGSLRLSRYVSARAGASLCGVSRNSGRQTPGSRKSARRVQRDGPHQIGPYRTENERNIHNVEEREEEKSIGEWHAAKLERSKLYGHQGGA